MGLDQYLTARLYVAEKVWPQFATPTPGGKGLEATLNEGLSAVGMQAQLISPHRGEPILNPAFQQIREAAGLDDFKLEHASGFYVELTVGYWRKCNQIHGWFEEHLESSDGDIKNVTDYVATREELTQLVDVCERVLATAVVTPPPGEDWPDLPDGQEYELQSIDQELVADLLPPRQGFFFGSNDVDIYYVFDLRETVTMLKTILAEPALLEADFAYRAWW